MELHANEARVWNYVREHADDQGRLEISMSKLAEAMGDLSISTVYRALRKLEKRGLLAVIVRPAPSPSIVRVIKEDVDAMTPEEASTELVENAERVMALARYLAGECGRMKAELEALRKKVAEYEALERRVVQSMDLDEVRVVVYKK